MIGRYTISSSLIRLATFLMLFGLAQKALAEPLPTEQEIMPSASAPERWRTSVGGVVRKMADQLDQFFGDERIDDEEQDTTLRIKPKVKWENGDGTSVSLRVRLNLKLPRLEDKWHVMLRSVSEEENLEDVDLTNLESQAMGQESETRTLFGIRFASIAEKLEHLSFSGGVKLRDNSIHPYTRARYRRTRELDKWSIELTQSGFYFSDDGFGETTRLVFERRIGDASALRATSKATFSDTSDGVDLLQSLTLRRFLEEDKAIEFTIGAEGRTHPSTIVEEYVAQVAYRQTLYSDWVFWEVGTQAIFPEDEDYHYVPALFTSIALVF